MQDIAVITNQQTNVTSIPDNHKWECPFCHNIKTGFSGIVAGQMRYAPVTKVCDCIGFNQDKEAQKQLALANKKAKLLSIINSTPEWAEFNEEWTKDKVLTTTIKNVRKSMLNWYLGVALDNLEPSNHGLCLYGKYGCGKTHLTTAIAKAMEKVKLPYHNGGGGKVKGGVYVMSERELAMTVFKLNTHYELAIECDVLIFDDFGTYKTETNSVKEALHQFYCGVIDKRMIKQEHKKYHLISTNLSIGELQVNLSPELFDRFFRMLGNSQSSAQRNFITLTNVPSYSTSRKETK